jgi:hypothetical protein
LLICTNVVPWRVAIVNALGSLLLAGSSSAT